MSLVVGLTGSIATGKSTISNMFEDWHIPVIDADLISRQVVEIGEPAYQQIVETFGEDILHEDRTLNRQALGAIVFKDEAERKKLNQIIHPQIRKTMLEQRDQLKEAGYELIVMDIPLLFESELFDYVDKVLVVYIDPEIQLNRLTERDQISAEQALEKINAQIPITEKRKRADAIINNGGNVEESKQQLINVLDQWGISIH
ncbi:dephospho-CoA kinase [Alkalibacillus almallahensis]|uniref:dephospho-CoA kinase n=1 Tax=Alkalibacillus almallahensis TaxID=1379154 RepID=UPI001420A431|nr:dephospho-CoA kinase [Alkalibacillus almallahensis]NIK11093.1 dephospho-CoA kinase [Alkalibacillus almallahensis]